MAVAESIKESDQGVDHLRRLAVALEQQVARYRAAHEQLAGGIAMLFSALNSEEYRCRGDHWSRRLTDDEVRDMDREGHPGEGDKDYLWVSYDRPPSGVQWVMPGACSGTITVEMESECDDMGYTLYSYPVAQGDCADALRLDEDESYSHPIWAEMSQRKYLRGVLAQTVDWAHGRHLVRDLRSDLVLADMTIDRLVAQRETARLDALAARP